MKLPYYLKLQLIDFKQYLKIKVKLDEKSPLFRLIDNLLDEKQNEQTAGKIIDELLKIESSGTELSIHAGFIMALLYLYGCFIGQNTERCLRLLEKGEKALHSPSMSFFAKLLCGTIGIKQDYSHAMKLVESCLLLNEGYGVFVLAQMHLNGQGVPKDTTKAVELLEKNLQSFGEIPHLLAEILFNENIDKKRAISIFEKEAEAGAASSKYSLSQIYLKGEEVKKDLEKAVSYCQSAANEKYLRAVFKMAVWHHTGYLVKKDIALSMALLEEGASYQDIFSTVNLAFCYIEQKTQTNKERQIQGLMLLESARRTGYKDILSNLYCYYMNGEFVERDPIKALEILQEGKDDPCCQLMALILDDKGQDKQPSIYMEALKTMIEKGNQHAHLHLACLYSSDEHRFSEQSKNEKAIIAEQKRKEELKKIVEDLSASAINQNKRLILASYFKKGLGVEKNNERAIQYYLDALEEGAFNLSVAEIEYSLARCYKELSDKVNGTQPLFQRIASLSDEHAKSCILFMHRVADNYRNENKSCSLEAQFFLSQYYGAMHDFLRELKYLNLAADGGHISALHELATLYKGEKKGRIAIFPIANVEKAIEYLKRASELGCLSSMRELAKRYAQGFGVTQDVDKALQLYFKLILKRFLPAFFDLIEFYINEANKVEGVFYYDPLRAYILTAYCNDYVNKNSTLLDDHTKTQVWGVSQRVAHLLEQNPILKKFSTCKQTSEIFTLLKDYAQKARLVDKTKAIETNSSKDGKEKEEQRLMTHCVEIMGFCYQLGLGDAFNPIAAASNFRQAQSMGSSTALRNYKFMLDQNQGKFENIEVFIQYCQTIGTSDAHYILGEIFENGLYGIDPDPKRAEEQYKLSFQVEDKNLLVSLKQLEYKNVMEISNSLISSFASLREKFEDQNLFSMPGGICKLVAQYAVNREELRFKQKFYHSLAGSKKESTAQNAKQEKITDFKINTNTETNQKSTNPKQNGLIVDKDNISPKEGSKVEPKVRVYFQIKKRKNNVNLR